MSNLGSKTPPFTQQIVADHSHHKLPSSHLRVLSAVSGSTVRNTVRTGMLALSTASTATICFKFERLLEVTPDLPIGSVSSGGADLFSLISIRGCMTKKRRTFLWNMRQYEGGRG